MQSSNLGHLMTSDEHQPPSPIVYSSGGPFPRNGAGESRSLRDVFDAGSERQEKFADSTNETMRIPPLARESNRPGNCSQQSSILRLCNYFSFRSVDRAKSTQTFYKNQAFQIRLSHFGIQETLHYAKNRLVVRAKPLHGTRAAASLPAQVVLKFLSYGKIRSKHRTKSTREVECQKAVHEHPNIATLLTTIPRFRQIVLVTKFSHGGDLFNALQYFRRGMPELIAIGIMMQILDAVAYMHGRGYAHRDIKLENVVLEDSDDVLAGEIPTVKLIDFGHSFHWDISRPRSRICMDRPYTEGYTPPEVFLRPWYCPKAVDMFCIGGVLYRLLSSRIPFRTGSAVTVAHQMQGDGVMFDAWSFDGVSQATCQFVRNCMSLDPKDRPNARFALCALERIREDLNKQDSPRASHLLLFAET